MKVHFQTDRSHILEAIALGKTGDTRVQRNGETGVSVEGYSSAVIYAMFKIGGIPGIRISVVESYVTNEDIVSVE